MKIVWAQYRQLSTTTLTTVLVSRIRARCQFAEGDAFATE
jgi:hypothetical protein